MIMEVTKLCYLLSPIVYTWGFIVKAWIMKGDDWVIESGGGYSLVVTPTDISTHH